MNTAALNSTGKIQMLICFERKEASLQHEAHTVNVRREQNEREANSHSQRNTRTNWLGFCRTIVRHTTAMARTKNKQQQQQHDCQHHQCTAIFNMPSRVYARSYTHTYKCVHTEWREIAAAAAQARSRSKRTTAKQTETKPINEIEIQATGPIKIFVHTICYAVLLLFFGFERWCCWFCIIYLVGLCVVYRMCYANAYTWIRKCAINNSVWPFERRFMCTHV